MRWLWLSVDIEMVSKSRAGTGTPYSASRLLRCSCRGGKGNTPPNNTPPALNSALLGELLYWYSRPNLSTLSGMYLGGGSGGGGMGILLFSIPIAATPTGDGVSEYFSKSVSAASIARSALLPLYMHPMRTASPFVSGGIFHSRSRSLFAGISALSRG